VIQADGTISNGFVVGSVQANCASGKRVLGGGCRVEHPNAATVAIDGHPVSEGYLCYFTTTGVNEGIHAYAICGVVQ
jgi:hypothetical protein